MLVPLCVVCMQVFLYISNDKKVMGCVFAEKISLVQLHVNVQCTCTILYDCLNTLYIDSHFHYICLYSHNLTLPISLTPPLSHSLSLSLFPFLPPSFPPPLSLTPSPSLPFSPFSLSLPLPQGYSVLTPSPHTSPEPPQPCINDPNYNITSTPASSKTNSVVTDSTAPESSVESGRSPLDTLSAWFCSSRAQPAVVGLNRVWVCQQHRRRGVASRILDAIRWV